MAYDVSFLCSVVITLISNWKKTQVTINFFKSEVLFIFSFQDWLYKKDNIMYTFTIMIGYIEFFLSCMYLYFIDEPYSQEIKKFYFVQVYSTSICPVFA